MFTALASLGLATLCIVSACSDGTGSEVLDSGAQTDSGTLDDSGILDAQIEQDSSLGGALPTECTGRCSQMSLQADFGGVVRTFDRAFFGLVSPAKSDSGEWEYYIEGGAGKDENCPSKASPTPLFLLIVSGIVPGTTVGQIGMPKATTLVDFEGALLPDSPLSRSTSRSLTWVASDGCIPCAEGAEPDRQDRMIAVDVSASFTEGAVSGHVYATHCDSLDDL